MKKTIDAVTVISIICFLLCGCAGSPEVVTSPSATPNNTATESTTPEETKTPVVTPVVTPVATPEPTGDETDGLPFNEPLELAYNYCPSVMELEDGTRYVYYCAVKESGVVKDYIYCRKGTKNALGGYVWGEKTLVLSPTEGTFDALHCCDPSVIKGNFTFKGKSYKYLMAYTGNTYHINNKVGLAVSNDPMSGWISTGEPFVVYDGDESHWGVGQPSLLSVDKQGTVMLFYSYGGYETCTYAEKWDFSNLDNPVFFSRAKIDSTSIVGYDGSVDSLNNMDIAYDESTKRYYIARDAHPYPTDGEPAFVASHFGVEFITEDGEIGDLFLSSSAQSGKSWQNIAYVGSAQTGFARNSNCGIIRNEYGYMIQSNKLDILYSMSLLGDASGDYAWTYRIHSYSLELK